MPRRLGLPNQKATAPARDARCSRWGRTRSTPAPRPESGPATTPSPIIAGAGVWKTVGLIVDGLPDGLGQAMVIGITAAAVTGWLAINALQRLAARSNFNAFVVYRVVLALVVLNLALTGLR
ncbi:MAG: hypothetical protein EB111_05760 [Actinobacteria bacterium]|nr:hypothetical protein [Actinomycetota bacterium]